MSEQDQFSQASTMSQSSVGITVPRVIKQELGACGTTAEPAEGERCRAVKCLV
ncbi:MAG TPA: hypothetical protein VEG43_04445 [Dehalococcoidia bacterium]|nr:hypothetical protein [Dehalococcoidia bacterium]